MTTTSILGTISTDSRDYLFGVLVGMAVAIAAGALVVFRLDHGLFKDLPGTIRRFRQAKNDMPPESQRAAALSKAALVVLVICVVGGNLATIGHPALSKLVLLVLALLPGIPLAFAIYWTIAIYRFGDELQKRVMTEGALVAVPFSVVALFIAGVILTVEPSIAAAAQTVYSVPIGGWALGMALAWKRHTGSALGIPADS